jgi:NADPH:quinone reductase-like Zn-dependent oxidoreductase
MNAMVYTEYGPPDVLQLKDVEKPAPKDKEVLVRVYASTVTSGVLWARSGIHPDSKLFTLALRLMFGIRRPRKTILGYEFSGEIESTGRDVRRFRTGEKVFGTTTGLMNGAYAEYVCIPEEWQQGVIAEKPANLHYEEAAAIPIGGMTALDILRNGKIQEGQTVLIYGASGSVGTYAVQLARHFGAQVTGVCSTTNLEMVRSLGAERVLDYTKEDFAGDGRIYDVVFDAVGKIPRAQVKRSLKETGTYLSVTSPTSEKTEYLTYLRELIEAGKVRPVIDRRYSLEQAAEAHRYVEKGRKKGNVVIAVEHQGNI